jgi:hypothetical protein
MPARRRLPFLLVAGDLATLLALSLIGFLDHNPTITARWLTTFLPLCAGWALMAPWIGNYSSATAAQPAHFWRAALAGCLAAPFSAFLRGLWLNTDIPPIFILVLCLTTALGMGLWRLLWGWIAARTQLWTKLA